MKYDYHCAKCGGLVPEPMKSYGYSGQYCHCETPTPPNNTNDDPRFIPPINPKFDLPVSEEDVVAAWDIGEDALNNTHQEQSSDGFRFLPFPDSDMYQKVYHDHDEDLARRSNGEQVIFTREELINLGYVTSTTKQY